MRHAGLALAPAENETAADSGEKLSASYIICQGVGQALGWHIILKPAIQAIYPSLTSQFILLMLNSSVCSAIAASELTAAAGDIQSRTFRSFEVYFVITCMYFAMSVLFWGIFGAIEKNFLRMPVKR